MTRLVFLFCAAILTPCVAFSQTAQPPVAELSELPADCLMAGEFTDLEQFCGIVEHLMGAIAEEPEPGTLRGVFGTMMGDPNMTGIALDRPVRFYYMNPKLHAQHWVYQVSVADAEALKLAMGATRPAPEGHPAGALEAAIEGEKRAEDARPPAESALGQGAPPAYLLVQDGAATIYSSATASKSLLDWQRAHPEPPQWRVAGQLRCRLAVQHILAAYGPEYAQEVQAMRDRMREALERFGAQPETEESIRSAQEQLYIASSLLKQVEDVDVGLELSESAALLRADALPLADSPLSQLIRAHPRGSLELFGHCPADVDMAIAQNVSAAGAASSFLLDRLGLPGVGRAIGSAAATHTLFGLVLPKEPDDAISALLIRTNQTAETAQQFWNRLTQGVDEPALSLRPVETPAGETASLAELAVNEVKLGADRARALRRIVGERPMAAQELRAGRSILAFGATPLSLLAQARALERDAAGSLITNEYFSRTVAGLPEAPNIVFYASPTAVSDWLNLAELPAAEPGAQAIGFAAGCSLRADGRMQAGIVVPLDQLLPVKPITTPR